MTRDCEATLIPSGENVSLKAGSCVLITQTLGNSYTVYVHGNLVRIAGKDGDALGLEALQDPDVNTMTGTLEEKIETILKTCYDPEIPVNIVDLGLIYEKQVQEISPQNYHIFIKMTLTAPGCGMGPVLVNDIQEKLKQIEGVSEVTVDMVFDPPWGREKMSEAAQLQLGLL